MAMTKHNIYYSKQGETLDLICHKYYGAQSGVVEQVLSFNQNLSKLGPVLPTGTKILLPEIELNDEATTTLF